MTRSEDNEQLVGFSIPFLVLTYIGAILFAVFAAQISNGACAIVANFQNGVYHTEESKKMSIAVFLVASVCMSLSGLYNDISHCKYVKGRLFFWKTYLRILSYQIFYSSTLPQISAFI